MDAEIKRSVSTGDTWIRLAYMVLFAFVLQVVEVVLVFIVIANWFFLLFTRSSSDRLTEFGDDLTVFNYQIWQFLTQNSDERPWPFAPWPYSTEGLDDEGPETVATAKPVAPAAEPKEPAAEPKEPAAEPQAPEAPEPPTSEEPDPSPKQE